jgi:hypothetical protein
MAADIDAAEAEYFICRWHDTGHAEGSRDGTVSRNLRCPEEAGNIGRIPHAIDCEIVVGAVTVTTADPDDPPKLVFPAQVAVSVLLPGERFEEETDKLPVAVLPETVSAAVPNVLEPDAKLTVPVGTAVPLAGRTVAVNCVEAPWFTVAGFAVSTVVVPRLETTPVQFPKS